MLTALCVRSKAHWGYDDKFMRRSALRLTVKPAMIEEGRVLVAEEAPRGSWVWLLSRRCRQGANSTFPCCSWSPPPSAAGLGAFCSKPLSGSQRRGGGSSLSILADPFAAGFYRQLGAVKVGEAPSDAIPGRYLPLFDYTISSRPEPS